MFSIGYEQIPLIEVLGDLYDKRLYLPLFLLFQQDQLKYLLPNNLSQLLGLLLQTVEALFLDTFYTDLTRTLEELNLFMTDLKDLQFHLSKMNLL